MCFLTSCPSGAQNDLTKQEAQASKFGLSQAEGTIPQGTAALQAPLNFFQALASGDRNTIMGVLSPEISTLTSQYDTGRSSAEEFAPRGGGRAAALEELPFQKAGAIENLVQGAQTTGVQGEANIGAMLSNLGLGELEAGGGIASQTVGQLQNQQQISNSAGASSGAAIGSLIALLAA